MALNIRNPEANRLAAEVAALAGETKTDAVIVALQERLQRLRRRQAAQPDARTLLVNQLDQIALRCAARPIRDPRSAEQILGYEGAPLLFKGNDFSHTDLQPAWKPVRFPVQD